MKQKHLNKPGSYLQSYAVATPTKVRTKALNKVATMMVLVLFDTLENGMFGIDGNPHRHAAAVITSDEQRHETIKRPCMFNDKGPAGVRTRPHAESLH